MCTVTHVQPRACNHTCSHACSHMCAVTCMPSCAQSHTCSHMCAVTCVQSHVCSHVHIIFEQVPTFWHNKMKLVILSFPSCSPEVSHFQETMIRISRECVLGTKISVLGRLTVATPLTTSSPPKGHKRLYLETSLFTDMNLKQKFTPIILIPNQQERVYSPFLHFHICVFFSPTARTPRYLSFYC